MAGMKPYMRGEKKQEYDCLHRKGFALRPRVYYASTKMKASKPKKMKPRRKEEFRVGRIRSWNEGFNTGGKEEGDPGVGNKMFKGRVYSRRSKKTKIIDIELGKAVMGETTIEGTDLGDCQGLEDHQFDFCESTDDSSSANFESDKEALLCIEADTKDERENVEEEGFEGIRYLMES